MIRLLKMHMARRRLVASLKPNPQYLKRRQASKLGWQRRRGIR